MQEERLFEDDHSAVVYLMETHFAVTTSELKKIVSVLQIYSASQGNQIRLGFVVAHAELLRRKNNGCTVRWGWIGETVAAHFYCNLC